MPSRICSPAAAVSTLLQPQAAAVPDSTQSNAPFEHKQPKLQPRGMHTAESTGLLADDSLPASDVAHKHISGQQAPRECTFAITDDGVTQLESDQDNHMAVCPSSAGEVVHSGEQATLAQSVKLEQRLSQTSSKSNTKTATVLRKPLRLRDTLPKPYTALQHYDSAPALSQATMTAGPETARRATSPTLLRNQHLPGVAMHQKTAFPANMTMKHEAGISSVAQGRVPRASGEAVAPGAVAAATGAVATGPTARPKSPTAMHNQQLQQLWRQHSSAEPSRSLRRLRSHSAMQQSGPASQKRAAPPRMLSQHIKTGNKLRQNSSMTIVDVPRKMHVKEFIQPFYETTSHSLGRSQTWASQWLALGSPDELTDIAHTQSLPNPLLERSTAGSTALLAGSFGTSEQKIRVSADEPLDSSKAGADLLPLARKDGTADEQLDMPLDCEPVEVLDADGGQLRTSLPAVPRRASADSPHSMGTTVSLDTNTTAFQWLGGRPQTAYVLQQKWQLDLKRLHSARPGSGGSPTARSDQFWVFHYSIRSMIAHDASQTFSLTRTHARTHKSTNNSPVYKTELVATRHQQKLLTTMLDCDTICYLLIESE